VSDAARERCEWCERPAAWRYEASHPRPDYSRFSCDDELHVSNTRRLVFLDCGDMPLIKRYEP
jgi:hypothetical protein